MENNGRGIFYGVIGVATLVVAIIGATFAYFSASAGGNETVTAGGATIDLKWSEDVTLIQDNLVPVETGFVDENQEEGKLQNTAAQFATYANLDPTKAATTWCQDKDGVYNVCSAYSITITNEGTAPITLDGSFTTVSNSVEHLKFAIFRGTATNVFSTASVEGGEIGWDVNAAKGQAATSYFASGVADGALLVSATDIASGENTVGTKLDLTLGAAGSGTETATFTILLWIEEIGTTQKSGGDFIGKVNFTTADGTGITGLIA
ncbi:MAG: hypothetical protein IJE89_03500 [Bacilli bacterium]|nr:hypothetical protein [Bacilli bacterium]